MMGVLTLILAFLILLQILSKQESLNVRLKPAILLVGELSKCRKQKRKKEHSVTNSLSKNKTKNLKV